MRPRIRIILLLGCGAAALAAAPTSLWTKGYSVVPTPAQVRLEGGDVRFDQTWRLDAGAAGAQHIAARTLRADLAEMHGLELRGGGGPSVTLKMAPGSVPAAAPPEILRQAYRLTIRVGGIELEANSDPGLLYAAATLAQLVRRDPAGILRLPLGVIEDRPAYQLRFLHWDTKHHQDRIPTLKRYLDWCVRLKVNMIGFELEDKFAYPSHPVIGAPGAFTPAELQEIVNYGLERFIQVVPVVQSPAHMGYVLKHPEFAALRADGNNYQSDLCDERTYRLILEMYDDVIAATKGVDYFFVSTDEVYYAGIGNRCQAPYTPENRSLALTRFDARARDHLASRGRRMLAWLEYPLLPQHLELIPADVIDGVVGEPEFVDIEKRRGMRQLAYTSMQGAEHLFPNHLRMEGESSHLEGARETLSSGTASRMNPIGVFGAAWDDSGLHNETFWLGWSAVAQWGWNPAGASVEQHAAEFMRLYYGAGVPEMIGVYRMLQHQARRWEDSWDRVLSKARRPGYGNSYGKGIGTERYDLTLTPPVPRLPDQKLTASFRNQYASRIADARANFEESDRLVSALQAAFGRVERNHYNVEVLLSLARFIGHQWRLLLDLAETERILDTALESALAGKPAEAVGRMLAAHDRVQKAEREGRTVFEELTAVYEKSRYPKGRVAGKDLVHVLDDTKDHWADRRPDLSFMVAAEQSIGLPAWRRSMLDQIEAYARSHGVPVESLKARRLEE